MINLYAIWSVARFEAKLLFRSWAFRIFSLLGMVILVFMDIGLGSTVGRSPHFFHSLSGSLPLMNIKLLNIYQGIIAAFLATEFIKRDRRHDTTQVVFTRSFSNTDYILGKVGGIFVIFAVLNLVVLMMGLVIHLFFSPTVFAWQPYVIYSLFISLPTLVFIIGLSFLLVTVLRSQAVVFVIMLGYSLLVLILLGPHLYQVFDCYAFYQPICYSDFIGLGNLKELLFLRGAYFLWGLGFIAATVLLTKRLRQSPTANVGAAVISISCFLAASGMCFGFLNGRFDGREYRQALRASSSAVAEMPVVTVKRCDVDLRHSGENLTATVDLVTVNTTAVVLDSLLFTLNPGLSITEITAGAGPMGFSRNNHLLWIRPASPVRPGDTVQLSVSYSGIIDNRYCYLDIDKRRFESLYRMWLYSVPKQYAFTTNDYVHLTHEAGWYPVSGLPNGAAFPTAAQPDYARYSLSVTIPEGQTAISQGTPIIDSSGGQHRYTFQPKMPLPQISLTIGAYETHHVEVDSVFYSLYYLPGHDYFAPFFDEVADTLPNLIRELKNEYEVVLGVPYPHDRFSLVEVPIQFYSYRRLWTVAQEMVQPQVVFLPEMGTICAGGDFQQMKRGATRRQERANQADDPKTIQAGYFTNFVKIDLLGMEAGERGIRRQENIEPRFEILPNFVSYTTHLSSDRWPILNYAFESYFRNRLSPPQDTRWRGWRGLTDEERANLALQHYSLSEIIGRYARDAKTAGTALQAKGRYLLSLLEAQLGQDRFVNGLTEFLTGNRFENISDTDLIDFVATFDEADLTGMIDTWYCDTLLPGYLVEEVESYKVLDGERIKTQVKFRITNPTTIDGVVKVSFRYRRQEAVNFNPWWMRGQARSDYARMLAAPAMTVKEIGVVLDQPPAEMTIETYVAQNIPSVLKMPFREQKLRRTEQPFVGEVAEPYTKSVPGSEGEYIVDNEDPGFSILAVRRENWLRRTLRGLFGAEDEGDPYVGMRFWDPPGNWVATTRQEFHGEFVHSGYYKESGDGRNNVAWKATLDEAGDYDIYYYEGAISVPRWGRRRQGGRMQNQGEKHFLIYHDDGIDNLPLDLNGVEEGWNYLGTYRLSAGDNRVELTDRNKISMVTADAVKWVKR